MNRRQAITTAITGLGSTAMNTTKSTADPFVYCLNMSTIMGQKLGFRKELEIAAKAGFRSVEIWINSLQAYLKEHTPADVRRLADDLGLRFENAIGFAPWVVDDEDKRRRGIDQLKSEMEQLREIGCRRIATPPVGATEGPALELKVIAERYRKILELGETTGVVPYLELWGFSKNLSRLSEALYVVTEADHPDGRLLLDIYHLYKGGSGHSGLRFVGKPLIELFHVNDYPATPPRGQIVDADRIYTGDGIAPMNQILQDLTNPGRPVIISLELFNKTYYTRDPLEVARTGLRKMQEAVQAARTQAG